jgi:hypothetical protein
VNLKGGIEHRAAEDLSKSIADDPELIGHIVLQQPNGKG